ncbi:hypothetical protein CMUS01_07613 [Colletotrichum musicola]|uniref:Uncharacterized protein n=1 Tax=Colletotrichum musicola TaxID=2175873 RepID=A0A8H6KFU4_9PEZI|nr:hypothetical protein CMUS01_07613 [Colletotrichum musicola]
MNPRTSRTGARWRGSEDEVEESGWSSLPAELPKQWSERWTQGTMQPPTGKSGPRGGASGASGAAADRIAWVAPKQRRVQYLNAAPVSAVEQSNAQ